MTVQLEYDLDVGALYVRLSDAEVARTVEEGDNAAVDLDPAGRVVGIEVISLAHAWPIDTILARYDIPLGQEAQLVAYFLERPWPPRSEISITSPAPAQPQAVAAV